jgi:hypothetical protein
MAAVPVTIVGIITTEAGSTNATMVGMASLTGLGIGGGPIFPPDQPPGRPEHPIAPVPPGRPEHPIAPVPPGHPEHPIVMPPEGNVPSHPIWLPEPPDQPPIIEPPPEGGAPVVPDGTYAWVMHQPSQQWHLVYNPGPGDAQPKR